MTDLVVNKTEARRNLFNLLKIAESGRRKLVIKGKNVRFHINVVFEKETKKSSWQDFFGKGNEKIARNIENMVEMTDKFGETKRKLW